jgi:hypothetical protein
MLTSKVSAKREQLMVAVLAIVLLTATAGLLGTAGADADGSPRSNFSIEQARAFTDFPLYYAGDSVGGTPLVAVLRRNDSANYVSFIYGTCDAVSETGCAPPGEVQVWPACVRNPARYAMNSSPIAPQSQPTSVRGVPAARFEDGHRLEIQTGTSTVVVFGHTPEFVQTLAGALRGVSNGVTTEGSLPSPAAGALEGKLACG